MDSMTVSIAADREISPEEHNEILDRAEEVTIDVLDLEPFDELVASGMNNEDLSDERIQLVMERLDEMGGLDEGNVIVPCPRCREDIIVMWAGVGGDSIDPETGEGSLSYKKGGGACPTCGLEATPVLTIMFEEGEGE